MNAQDLLACLEPIVSTCILWKKKKVRIVVIANPNAGGFTQKKSARAHFAVLTDYRAEAEKKTRICTECTGTAFYTEYAGHAAALANQTVLEAVNNSAIDYLLVCAGGDGTSLEIQTELVRLAFEQKPPLNDHYEKAIKERIAVLRLPFGTGNDGSDGRTMAETLKSLTHSTQFVLQSAVRVYYTGLQNEAASCGTDTKKQVKKIVHYDSLSRYPPWYAFNIASIGIDAYIAHMTNHTKGVLPGNFYKLWIDLACIFYELQFPTAVAKITAYDAQGTITQVVNEAFLFCLMGVSGRRTYGCNQKILPDNRNVCMARQISLLKKLLLKEQFKSGKHGNNAAAILFNAEKLVIEYNRDILTQLDGEIHYVQASQFPLVFERTDPIIRCLARS